MKDLSFQKRQHDASAKDDQPDAEASHIQITQTDASVNNNQCHLMPRYYVVHHWAASSEVLPKLQVELYNEKQEENNNNKN